MTILVILLAVALLVQTWRLHAMDRRRAAASRARAGWRDIAMRLSAQLPADERDHLARRLVELAEVEHPPPG